MRPTSVLATIVIAALLLACTTSPTGRRQFQLMPESQLNAMGDEAYSKMKSETPTVDSGPSVTYANCISHALIDVVPREYRDEDWEVTVFRSDQVNAFALPGGKIGIYTGLMEVAETPDQLAAVVGHEIGHVMADHGNERVSNQMAAQLGLNVAAAVASNDAKGQLLMGALGLGTQVGVLLPFSRTHEREADDIGLDLMAKAGFEPRESVKLWQNMAAKKGGGGPPEFLSTHPANETRINNLKDQMPQAQQAFQRARQQGRNPNCPRPDSFPKGDKA
jgi:predicted Zn-dependent protease